MQEHIAEILETIPSNVKLVAVSKTRPVEDINLVYQAGIRNFGENKVQEMAAKYPLLPNDINWHLIGHLQTNKVKLIAPFVSLIHSVDSLKLLVEINRQAEKNNRIIDCLLQLFIATEETKYGLDYEEAIEIINSEEYGSMKNIRIRGLMGMATFTENLHVVRHEFKSLKLAFDQIKEKYFNQDPNFSEISMGMSGDYIIAIEEGSTIVRIGTAIFGERSYGI